MSQCPVCSASIEESFGLIECSSCHKILFADFDGSLKVHEEGPSESSSRLEMQSTTEYFEPVIEAIIDPIVEPGESFDPIIDPVIEPAIEPTEEPEARERTAVDEVNEFASSEASSLNEGPLIYNLTIKNIDTEDLKLEILEVLKESRLNIDIKNLKFALPTLELKDLNPIKVSVIVSKIKHLPVELEWIQRSIIVSKESSID